MFKPTNLPAFSGGFMVGVARQCWKGGLSDGVI